MANKGNRGNDLLTTTKDGFGFEEFENTLPYL